MNQKRLALILLTCFVLFSSVYVGGVSADTEGEFVERQLIVRLEDDTSDTIADINNDYNTTTIDVINAAANIYLLQTAPGVDAEALVDILDPSGNGGDARIEYAEANYLSDLPEGNPESVWAWGGQSSAPLNTQYASALHHLSMAHAYTLGGGATVAIIDGGFQLDHPELASRWTTARYDFADNDNNPADVQNGLDDDGDSQIDEAYGHGTHVAGIVNLVAPQAKLMPIRTLDSDGRANLWRIGEALNFAIVNGANVINLSLGTDYESELLEDLVLQAESAGVVIVAAAGNLGNTVPQYPAAFSTVMAVSSADSNQIKASSANYGGWVDIVAAGVSIYSSFPVDGYAWWSGTSMATPIVAGEAALLHAGTNGRSATRRAPANLRTIIKNHAINIDSENPTLVDQLGSGLADVGAAVQSLGLTPTGVKVSAQEVSVPDNHAPGTIFAFALLIILTWLANWQPADID